MTDLVLLLAAASAGANEQVAALLRARGMTQVRTHHGYLFQHLLPGPKTVRELATLLGVTPQAVSKTVAEMERLGWVTRAVGSTDQRTRQVSLTAAGHAVVSAGREARAEVERALTRTLGEFDLDGLRAALSVVAAGTGGTELLHRRALRP